MSKEREIVREIRESVGRVDVEKIEHDAYIKPSVDGKSLEPSLKAQREARTRARIFKMLEARAAQIDVGKGQVAVSVSSMTSLGTMVGLFFADEEDFKACESALSDFGHLDYSKRPDGEGIFAQLTMFEDYEHDMDVMADIAAALPPGIRAVPAGSADKKMPTGYTASRKRRKVEFTTKPEMIGTTADHMNGTGYYVTSFNDEEDPDWDRKASSIIGSYGDSGFVVHRTPWHHVYTYNQVSRLDKKRYQGASGRTEAKTRHAYDKNVHTFRVECDKEEGAKIIEWLENTDDAWFGAEVIVKDNDWFIRIDPSVRSTTGFYVDVDGPDNASVEEAEAVLHEWLTGLGVEV